jgi:hypothetical protein
VVRWVVRWSGLFFGFIGAVACDSSTTGATDANAGASGSGASVSVAGMGTGGAHAGASSGGGDGKSGSANGAGDAGGGASDNMASACAEYAIASCERDQECGGRDPQVCLFSTPRCPDVVFSPGSTRTVAGLKACAKTYKTFDCDALARGEVPDCVSPGTRKPGESCLFSAQCASLACESDGSGGCGVCVARAKRGESCSAPNTACAYGLSCSGGVCVINGDAPASVGDACASDKDCTGLDCSSSDGTCHARPTLGMSCAEHLHCAENSYCAQETHVCEALPSAGSPCGYDAATLVHNLCATNAECYPLAATAGYECTPLRAIGQPCLIDQNSQMGYGCASGAYCDQTAAAPTCRAVLGAGMACTEFGQCATGLDCACANGSRNCADDQLHCVAVHFAGDTCDVAGAVCHDAFECVAGVCQPRPLTGAFDKACTP